MNYTFYLICTAVFAVLIILRILPNFTRLAPGETYSTRSGHHTVTIRHQIRQGAFDIFIDQNGVRYFADGHRVGDVTKSTHRLLKRM